MIQVLEDNCGDARFHEKQGGSLVISAHEPAIPAAQRVLTCELGAWVDAHPHGHTNTVGFQFFHQFNADSQSPTFARGFRVFPPARPTTGRA